MKQMAKSMLGFLLVIIMALGIFAQHLPHLALASENMGWSMREADADFDGVPDETDKEELFEDVKEPLRQEDADFSHVEAETFIEGNFEIDDEPPKDTGKPNAIGEPVKDEQYYIGEPAILLPESGEEPEFAQAPEQPNQEASDQPDEEQPQPDDQPEFDGEPEGNEPDGDNGEVDQTPDGEGEPSNPVEEMPSDEETQLDEGEFPQIGEPEFSGLDLLEFQQMEMGAGTYEVLSNSHTDVKSTGAEIRGSYKITGDPNARIFVHYGKDQNNLDLSTEYEGVINTLGTQANIPDVNGKKLIAIGPDITTGLDANTRYYYQLVIETGEGEIGAVGPIGNFTTTRRPQVETRATQQFILGTRARVHGWHEGATRPSEMYFRHGMVATDLFEYDGYSASFMASATASGDRRRTITILEFDEMYYYQFFLEEHGVIFPGDVPRAFTQKTLKAHIVTAECVRIDANSVTLKGNIDYLYPNNEDTRTTSVGREVFEVKPKGAVPIIKPDDAPENADWRVWDEWGYGRYLPAAKSVKSGTTTAPAVVVDDLDAGVYEYRLTVAPTMRARYDNNAAWQDIEVGTIYSDEGEFTIGNAVKVQHYRLDGTQHAPEELAGDYAKDMHGNPNPYTKRSVFAAEDMAPFHKAIGAHMPAYYMAGDTKYEIGQDIPITGDTVIEIYYVSTHYEVVLPDEKALIFWVNENTNMLVQSYGVEFINRSELPVSATYVSMTVTEHDGINFVASPISGQKDVQLGFQSVSAGGEVLSADTGEMVTITNNAFEGGVQNIVGASNIPLGIMGGFHDANKVGVMKFTGKFFGDVLPYPAHTPELKLKMNFSMTVP